MREITLNIWRGKLQMFLVPPGADQYVCSPLPPCLKISDISKCLAIGSLTFMMMYSPVPNFHSTDIVEHLEIYSQPWIRVEAGVL